MSRRKRSRRKSRRRSGRRTFRIDLRRIEIARGHDGWLRGDPEASLLVGSYLIDEGDPDRRRCELLSRELVRVEVQGPYPAVLYSPVVPVGRSRRTYRAGLRWVILALALEQDGGEDIALLYEALAEPSRLLVYPTDEMPPDPRPIDELADTPTARGLHVLLDGEDVAERLRTDDWIGAAAFEHPPSCRVTQRRVRFADQDGLNDWTFEFVTRRRA